MKKKGHPRYLSNAELESSYDIERLKFVSNPNYHEARLKTLFDMPLPDITAWREFDVKMSPAVYAFAMKLARQKSMSRHQRLLFDIKMIAPNLIARVRSLMIRIGIMSI